jgi:amino acid adenylation domain-containing protein
MDQPPAAVALVIGVCLHLIARYSREEDVTVDLTARAQAALRPTERPSPSRPLRRVTVSASGGTTAHLLADRLCAAAATAAFVNDHGESTDRGVLIDVGTISQELLTYDVHLGVTLRDEGVVLDVAYDAALYDDATMVRFRDAACQLLAAVVTDPAQPLDRVALITTAERLLMDEWNATDVPRHGDQLVHELIARQVARTPDAIAAAFGGARLTYRELGLRAGALTAALRARGVGQGDVVGVCLDRSFEMLVALVAVPAVGGAFLPLDPELPRERLAYMLHDANCALVLTHERHAAEMRHLGVSVMVLDLAAMAAHPNATLGDPSLAEPETHERPAYVIYTSGSTGRPKGVQVPHRALSNHALWFRDFVGLTERDRVLQIASICFDASLAEIFAPLTVGATIVLAPRDAQRDVLGLAAVAAAERITVMQQVPSLLRIMVRSPAFASLTALRYLVSGGEPLHGALASEILRALPNVRLGNCYGPTEATVDALAYEVPRGRGEAGLVPIGGPIANARCRILDEFGALLPIGMPGELYVGGAGVAHGYLNLPERTAFRFVSDPWLPGATLYRTGDVARYRADGTVECLGRLDAQVKLRGYRIEPAEIESVLLQHPSVCAATVLVREDTPDEQQLVAYVAVRETSSALATELRQQLRTTCPAWMIPSAFCFLDRLPVMPSGKIDRRALPVPEATSLASGAGVESAGLANSLERSLQGIWESVLGVRPIGPDDDFFALGGHSLKAIRLLSEIERVHGVAMRAATFFEAPTVRALANRMAASNGETGVSTVVRVQAEGTRTPLFLAPGGGGELFIFDALARAFGRDQPLYILDLYVFDEIELPVADVTLADVAARMLVDIRAVQPRGPYQLAGYSLGGNIAVELAQQLRAAGEEVYLLALLDCDGPDYPVLQPLPQRAMTHVRHALTLSPARAASYVGTRLRRAVRRVLPLPPPLLYHDQPDIELVPTHMIEALEHALRPVLQAWERYRPQPYDGRTLIVRADIRPVMIGVNDDDPRLGWSPVLRGEVLLDRLPSDHFAMFHAENVSRFVTMLERYLLEGPLRAEPALADAVSCDIADAATPECIPA